MKKLTLLTTTLMLTFSLTAQALIGDEFNSNLKKAKLGDSNAQYTVAVAYAQGDFVPKDEKEAIKWYEKAANLGNSSAQYDLAVMLLNKSYPQYSIEEVSDQHKAMELLLESAKQQNNDAFMLLSEIYEDFPNKKEYKKIDLSRYVNSPYYTYHSNSSINNEYILKSGYNIFYDDNIRDISTSEGLLLRSIEKGNKKGIRKFCEEAKFSEYRQYFSNLSRHPYSRLVNTDYDFKNIQKIITNLAEQGDYDMLKCTTLAIPNRYWAVKLVTHPDFSWTGLENKEKKTLSIH